METQQDNYHSQAVELPFPKQVIYSVLFGIGFLILSGFLLFKTTSIELICSRSSLNSIECSLIRNTPLLKMSPIKILDPLAVDVISHRQKGVNSYSAEIRVAHLPYTLPILSTYDYNLAQHTADKVNAFFLKSDAASFFGRFPEQTNGRSP